MPFKLFHDLFPEVAERETRTMSVVKEPSGALRGEDFGFLEMFREKIDKKIDQPPKTEWWRKKRKLR